MPKPKKTASKTPRKYTPDEIKKIEAEGKKQRLLIEHRQKLIDKLGEKEYRRRLT